MLHCYPKLPPRQSAHRPFFAGLCLLALLYFPFLIQLDLMVPPTAPLTATLGNRVWEDVNGNGIQDANEPGVLNVTVRLLSCAGDSLAQTRTDSNGLYRFENVPEGSYKLRFELQSAGSIFSAGVFTLPKVGTDSLDSDVNPTSQETACFTTTPDQQNLHLDAGVYVPASIGNQVWVDNNRNNVFDGGDVTLGGVTVKLYRCDTSTTPLATQTTGSNGLYLFGNLAPGSYKVEFGLPPTGAYERVLPNIGSDATDSDAEANGFTGCYTLQSRSQNLTVDAGYTFCGAPVNLTCITNANLVMNETCSLKVTPAMLLTTPPFCTNNLEVRIGPLNGTPFGDVVTSQYVGQTLRAVVIDKQTNNFCTSNIVVRDVSKPTIVCPPNTNKAVAAQQIQQLSGTLTTLSNSANLATLNCFRAVINPGGGNHFYNLDTFSVTRADIYTFELSPMFGDGAALLYEGEPDSLSLCQGVLAQSYQSFTGGVFFTNLNPILRLTARLQPGKIYTLLTTSRAPGAVGSYFWAAYSDGTGFLNGLQAVTTQAGYDLICNDIEQILNKNTSLALVGTPLVADNCGVPAANVTFTDQVLDGGTCGGNTITRTFTARDASGNTAQCSQLISVRKPTLADVIYPPLTARLECNATFPLDSKGNPSPAATGYPFIKTAFGNYDLTVPYCNIAATYVDKPQITGCANTYTVLREWTIADFCRPTNLLSFNQFIEVGDTEPPTVECLQEDYDGDGTLDTLVIPTSATACSATFDVPAPIVLDNCSAFTFTAEVISDTLMIIRDPFGFIIDTKLEKFVRATVSSTGSRLVSNVPVGNHTFKYTVTDACGNRTVLECPFQVRDLSPPMVICKSSITASLGGAGSTQVFARDINESSRDNCAIDSILIRRKFVRQPTDCDTILLPYWSEWDTMITVSCCDVGTKVDVEVKVLDKAGNANECSAQVEVLDKIKPFCVAPPAMTISCTALPKEFNPFDTLTLQSFFGVATATDNCGATWQELDPSVNLSECNIGTITRRFRTVDRFGNTSINTCQQVITITKINNYEIKFPKDVSVQCGTPFADTLQLNRLACDRLSVNVTEERFSGVGNECYRIFKTFRVINFCEYDGVSQPIVIGRDEDCDNNAGDEDVWIVRRPGNVYVDRNNSETDNLPAAGQRGCSPANPRGYWRTTPSVGYWQYTQIIKVFDTIPPDVIFAAPTPFCAISDNCIAQVKIPIVISEACAPDLVTVQVTVDLNADGTSEGPLASLGGVLSGTYPNFEIAGNFAKGSHRFNVQVQDGCRNSATEYIDFQVVDCKAPAPVCAGSLTVNLQPIRPARDINGDGTEDRGAVTVKATQLINAPAAADCSGPVRYSINRAGQLPNRNLDSLVFTCADLAAPILVEIYAWDSAVNPYAKQPDGGLGGPNFSRCQALITIQDEALNACAPPNNGLVMGEIRTEDGDPVEDAWVVLSGQTAATTQTEINGTYNFAQLEEGYDYTVAPLLDTNHVNGVSTIDLIIITKHILGVQLLDSPYKIIAADVNNSKNISTLDLIQMRKLILGIDLKFANNTSWRFVNATYRFPVPNNPWFETFPEVYNLNDLSGTFDRANFVAVKIGDVNLNASTTNEAGIRTDTPHSGKQGTNGVKRKRSRFFSNRGGSKFAS